MTRRFLTVLLLTTSAFAAAPITGTVTNGTSKKPSAGDEVVLIRLAQGMQESTRTTTDARGHYSLMVPDDGLHLVRVTHDKANYFQPAPAGTAKVDLQVFDSAEHVKGVATGGQVLRIQTDAPGTTLKIVENFFVENTSTPPMTQFSKQPFDFYMPEGAVIEGSAALAPGGMPVQAAPVPLADKNHYTFLFPIRPGETRFQISYHVPYTGTFHFDPRATQATDTVALMMPKSINFTAVNNAPYSAVNDEVDAQTYVARNVNPGSPLGFTITGKGELPRDASAANGQQGSGARPAESSDTGDVAATNRTSPGKGLDNPLDPEGTRDPWGKYKYWILAGLALVLAAGAGLLLRKPSGTADPAAAIPPVQPPAQPAAMLTALKDELFALETDRLQGRLSEPDYLQQKAALELILKRALTRTANPTGPTA